MVNDSAGREALRHLEAAIGEKPKKNAHALSAALRCLAAFRQELVAETGRPVDARGQKWLDHVNGVISSVMAVQFPLGEVPWIELDKARDWLAKSIEGVAARRRAEA